MGVGGCSREESLSPEGTVESAFGDEEYLEEAHTTVSVYRQKRVAKKKDKDAVRRPCGVVFVDILVRGHRVEMRVSEKCKLLEGKGTGRKGGG